MQIQAEKVTMYFDDAGRRVEIFRDLSFTVASGSSLAIVGRSGVGKTTLLNLIGGLECPVTGDVSWDGKSISERFRSGEDIAQLRGRNVGFVFQFHYLLPEFDALENVAMPLLIAGENPAAAAARAQALLERVGLRDRLGHRPGMLSGGEQQRVAMARALAAKPGLLLADEPTGNLDTATGREVSSLLLEVHREERATLVVVTHSRELAQMMDRVVELTPTGFVEQERSHS